MGALRLDRVLHAEDMEASARFYEELFGMRAAADAEVPAIGALAGARRPAAPSLPTRRRRGAAAHHLAIDVDDFNAFYRQAKERGLLDADTWGRPARYHPAGWVQMYIRDPSGNLIEIDWPDVSTLDPEIVAELGRLKDDAPQDGEAHEATLYDAGVPVR